MVKFGTEPQKKKNQHVRIKNNHRLHKNERNKLFL